MTRTKTVDTAPAETPAERVTRLRGELEAVRAQIASMRQARGRGEAVDPLEITAARDLAELLTDQLQAAEDARARGDAAEEARREAEQARVRLTTVAALLDTTESHCEAVRVAAESLAAALDALHQHAIAVGRTEPGLGAKWINGTMARAFGAVTGCWPQGLGLPEQRPIPFRPPERRAAWPREEREVLRLLLGPLPALPADPVAAAPDAAA